MAAAAANLHEDSVVRELLRLSSLRTLRTNLRISESLVQKSADFPPTPPSRARLMSHHSKNISQKDDNDKEVFEIKISEEIGSGRFGVVYKTTFRRKVCAVKVFRHVGAEEKPRLYKKLSAECDHLRKLVHPNVVQILGMYYHERHQLPMMVMELMDTSLTTFIEKSNIRTNTKLCLLHDVAIGLHFLHARSTPIIHRDLSPNNILLNFIGNDDTLPIAKIADLGLAKFKCQYSNKPRSVDFLAPEALIEKPWYDTPLDVFAYGGIVLYTINEEWPTPVNPEKQRITEYERRQKYLDMMKTKLSALTELTSLVEACLSNDPACRPSAAVIWEKVELELVQLNNAQRRNIDALLSRAENSVAHPPCDECNKTPLHVAAINGQTAIVEGLIRAGANVNAVDDDSRLPGEKVEEEKELELQLIKTQQETVGLQISEKPNQQQFNRTPLHDSAKNGHAAVVEGVIRAGADINAVDRDSRLPGEKDEEEKELESQLIKTQQETVGLQISGKPNQQQYCNPWNTVVFKDTSRLKVIFVGSEGAGKSSLIYTFLDPKFFMDINEDPASNVEVIMCNKTPLHNAAINGLTAIVEGLIRAGENVNAIDDELNCNNTVQKILQHYRQKIVDIIQPNYLLPLLLTKKLVSEEEFRSISDDCGHLSDRQRNGKLLDIVAKKGEHAFDLLVSALKEEENHLDHESLTKKLEEEKAKLPKPQSRWRILYCNPWNTMVFKDTSRLKVILVGSEGAGKTSSINTFLGQKFFMDKNEDPALYVAGTMIEHRISDYILFTNLSQQNPFILVYGRLNKCKYFTFGEKKLANAVTNITKLEHVELLAKAFIMNRGLLAYLVCHYCKGENCEKFGVEVTCQCRGGDCKWLFPEFFVVYTSKDDNM